MDEKDKDGLDNILDLLDDKDFYRLIVQLSSEAAYIGNDILAKMDNSKFASCNSLEKRKRRMKEILTGLTVLSIMHKDYGHDVDIAADFLAEIYATAKLPRTGNSGLDTIILGLMKNLGRAIGKETNEKDKKPSKDDAKIFFKNKDGIWAPGGKVTETPKFEDPDFHNKDMNDFWKEMLENLKGDQNDESDTDESGN